MWLIVDLEHLPLAADEVGGVLEARGADALAELFAGFHGAREVHASIQTRRAAGRRERVDRVVRERDVLSRRRAGLDLRGTGGRDVLERRQRDARIAYSTAPRQESYGEKV